MSRQWYKILNKSAEVAEVRIYGQIGGWGITAAKFVEDLNAITAKEISLRINSSGGEVFDGLAIYNAVKNHPANISVQIDGIAASISSVIACAGDKVCIAKNAFMMVHNVMSACFGYAEDLRKEADICDKLSLSAAQIYVDRTGKSLQEVQKAMGDETWFNAAEAKEFGLVDSVAEEDPEEGEDEELVNASVVATLKFKNTPEKLRKYAACLSQVASIPKQKKEPSMAALGMISRDGKNFVKIGDTEYEVAVTGSLTASASAGLAATNAVASVDIEAVKAQAVKSEREYASNFRAALSAAGIKDKAAEEFETKFYGRAIDDVKFLASHAIGTRAKALGEGEAQEKKPEEKAAESVEADATKRFAAEADLRKLYGVGPYDDAETTVYKAGFKRYLAREKAWAVDKAAGKHQHVVSATK